METARDRWLISRNTLENFLSLVILISESSECLIDDTSFYYTLFPLDPVYFLFMERPNSPRKLITYSMKGDNGESIIQDRWLFEIPRVTSRPLAPISIPKKRAYITVVNNGKDSRTRLVSSFYLENRRRPRSIDPSCPRESRILPVWNLGRPPLIELLLFFFFFHGNRAELKYLGRLSSERSFHHPLRRSPIAEPEI